MVGERQTGHTNRAYLRSFIGRRKKGNSKRPPGKRKRKRDIGYRSVPLVPA